MGVLLLLIPCLIILRYCWNAEQDAKAKKAEFLVKLEVLVRNEQKEKADMLARIEALEKLVKP